MYQPSDIDNLKLKNTESINSSELASLLKSHSSEIVIFDFRNVEDYKKGHIPGAKQYNVNEKEIKQEDLDKNKIIIIYSQTIEKSSEIVHKLKNTGYNNTFYLEGGWSEGWEPFIREACSTCGKSSIKSRLSNLLK